MRVFYWSILASATLLAACSTTRTTPAPIVDGNAIVATPQPAAIVTPKPVANLNPATAYTVQKGDTLYRIASQFKVTPQNLMAWNQLPDSNIKIGQVLKVAVPVGEDGVAIIPLSDAAPAVTPATNVSVKTISEPKAVKQVYSVEAEAAIKAQDLNKVAIKQQQVASLATASQVKPVTSLPQTTPSSNPNKSGLAVASSSASSNTNGSEFGMPTSGKIIRGFSDESKGIDIAGKLGQSIVASAQGKVVYAGAGLRGYGKMVILQHSNGYLTAYAHNDKLLVKEGDVVKKGEKIAEMGKSDAEQVKLHFEVRKGGKPVDPAKFIATE